ncbi:MAG: PIN domain nuclease [Spirochaetaceae bacterium]|nr:MAG: PIN domain nuclease [Spirochaetaceae bacterium]
MTVYLDTHVAAYVHTGDLTLLSPTAIHMLEAAQSTRISAMVVLELQYLYEQGQIAYPGDQIAGFLHDRFGVVVDSEGVGAAVLHATSFAWTRDPFDRTITAQAARAGAFLLTRDPIIRDNYAGAVW